MKTKIFIAILALSFLSIFTTIYIRSSLHDVSNRFVLKTSQGEFKLSDKNSKVLGYPSSMISALENPSDTNTVFISSTKFLNDDLTSCTNLIFTYKIHSDELTLFYSETATGNSPIWHVHCRTLGVFGIQDSKIIIKSDDPENSPGFCMDYWFASKENFYYVELADLQGGLKKYTVPKELIEEGEKSTGECLKELKDKPV
jgi:hypothetical protein